MLFFYNKIGVLNVKRCKSIESNENIIRKYTRSLLSSNSIMNSPISSLYGYHKSMRFEMNGINTIGDMYEIFKLNDMDIHKFVYYLRMKLNVYSTFYINNIIKQINVINYFIS